MNQHKKILTHSCLTIPMALTNKTVSEYTNLDSLPEQLHSKTEASSI